MDIHPMYEDRGGTLAERLRRYQRAVEPELTPPRTGKAFRFSERQVYGSEMFIQHFKQNHRFTVLRDHTGRPKNGT